MKQGYAESTIKGRVRFFKNLMKRADVFDPESVKLAIAQSGWSEGRKEAAVYVYLRFCEMKGLQFLPPRYKRVDKLPYIPLESEIDLLIASVSNKIAAYLHTMKETGVRPGEAWALKWIDVDFARNRLTFVPEKGSNPRVFKVSNKLVNLLNRLPRVHERVFGKASVDYLRRNFNKQRKRIANKLSNPRLQAIKLTTLRHWKATMEYHKTKDILHVMKVLGHKNIKNTLRYTQLLPESEDEYVSKVAHSIKEARELIEQGFQYVCEIECAKLFKKRK